MARELESPKIGRHPQRPEMKRGSSGGGDVLINEQRNFAATRLRDIATKDSRGVYALHVKTDRETRQTLDMILSALEDIKVLLGHEE